MNLDQPKNDIRECWTAELDDGTEVLVETFDRVTFTIASRPRPLRGLPWSPPIRLEPQQ